MVVIEGRWSLFGGGRYLRFDCTLVGQEKRVAKNCQISIVSYLYPNIVFKNFNCDVSLKGYSNSPGGETVSPNVTWGRGF